MTLESSIGNAVKSEWFRKGRQWMEHTAPGSMGTRSIGDYASDTLFLSAGRAACLETVLLQYRSHIMVNGFSIEPFFILSGL